MPIEDRNVEAGTVLTARYKKQDRTCEVIETDDGLRFKLDTGELYRSPSSAGKAAMDGVACNGWRFWSVQGQGSAQREPKAKADKPAKAKTAKKPSGKKPTAKTEKAKSARARAQDVPSYGCGGCGATFGSQKAAVAHALTHTTN
jgi:hypothetical protein